MRELPLLAKPGGCAAHDRFAVPEARDVEVERGELAQAVEAILQRFVTKAQTKTHHVAGGVGGEQHAAPRPQKRELSGALSRDVERLQPAGDRQLGAVVDLLVDRAGLERRWG